MGADQVMLYDKGGTYLLSSMASPGFPNDAAGVAAFREGSEAADAPLVISEVLTRLGAPICGMGIIEARLEKELNNKVNRRCNCDDANTSKVVEAAQEQLAAIRILRKK